jgi:pimeloyl-ACP methyl ester carboxylesterase
MRLAGWLAASLGAAAVGLAAYLVYVGSEGSAQVLAISRQRGVKRYAFTPAIYGWDYEAVNYDIADDERLRRTYRRPDGTLDEARDLADCEDLRGSAGAKIVTPDGIRVAAWYIPAANGMAPDGPTIVLVHGNPANKGDMLRYAIHLHDAFNLVLPDLRNSGRSSGIISTTGILEHQEIHVVIDWLVTSKRPRHIGALGDSGGAATALMAARSDERIEAVVTDSSHATQERAVAAGMRKQRPPHPAYPGTWAIMLGFWLRTGHRMSEADPIDSVRMLGTRPYLILHGQKDTDNLPELSAEPLRAAAERAGVPVTLRYCEGGTHGQLANECAREYPGWVIPFFERAFAGR